jgi:4-amino-4-deoxy-L-arabinose transferase-like glycosyltransferase
MAALFQTVFGTLWLEQTAFFFGFLAVWAVMEASARRKPASWLFLMLAGVFLALSILSKQNAGILMTILAFGLVIVQSLPRLRQILASLAACAAGLGLAAASFALWLFAFSDPSRFVAAWKGAAEIGASRVTGATLLKILLLHPSGMSSELAGLACLAVGGVAIVVGFSDSPRRGPLFSLAPLGYLCAGSVLVQSAFQATTLNERQNVLFFSCYALALAAAAFAWLVRNLVVRTSADSNTSPAFPPRRAVRLAGVGTLLALYLGIALLGLDASWTRVVQQFPPGSTFAHLASDPTLRGLRLGSPDLVSLTDHVQLRTQDFEAVVHYLRGQQGDFFVFGDSTLLYGMLHRPSPQPLLYFQQKHSYFPGDIPAVDRAVVDALQKNHVSIVVNETSRWQPHPDPIQSFPLLWSWMQRDFHVVARFGVYEVWEKNKASVAAAEGGKP